MVEALLLAPMPGVLARFVLPSSRAGVMVTVVASLLGWALGYAVFHELMGFHELHAFEPEGLVPETVGAVLALVAIGRVNARRQQAIFTRR